jgi:phenylacetate-CoA ligase
MAGLRSAVLTWVLDPLIWKYKRLPIGVHLADFRACQWDAPDVFAARQAKRLAHLLVHAVTRVPYYRERAGDLSAASIEVDPVGCLHSLPILEREDIRDRLDDLVCEIGRGTRRDHTSGSTGMPLDFVRDRHSVAASLATTLLSFDWAGIERGDRRVRFWGSPIDLASEKSRLKRFINALHDRTVVDSYRMDDAGMQRYTSLLRERPPVSLEGYPEALYRVAEYAKRHELEMPKPRAIIAGGSTVHDHIRKMLSDVFGAPVFNHYGSREIGLLSAECDRHAGMHVMGETTILEVVDERGAPVEDGETGDIIATHLWNYTMPFIRYRTGDRGALGRRPCTCGRVYPLLDRVVGRTGECFVRGDGALVIPEFFIQLLAWEFSTPDVRKFQVVQEAVDRVTVRMIPQPGTEGFPVRVRKRIEERISEALGGPCTVTFIVEDDIDPAASGKYFYTVSEVQRRQEA